MPASDTREAVATLRDRVKHGQNMTKILESQLDTAQQNISLLQGQVRLANETILNLKKYFTETESTLNELLPNHSSSRVFHFDAERTAQQQQKDEDELSQKHGNVDSTTRSPISTNTSSSSGSGSNAESHKHEDKRDHHNKSPYAQQLRQVLDVLQDEEPRKSSSTQYNHHHHDITQHKDCACADCQTPTNYTPRTKTYHETDYTNKRSGDEYMKPKHKANGHPREANISPKSPFLHKASESMHVHHSYSNHCTGPCCVNDGCKVEKHSLYYAENEKQQHHHPQQQQQQQQQQHQQHQNQQQQQQHQLQQQQKQQQHYLDKSPPSTMHYTVGMHSPDLPIEVNNRRVSEHRHGHHCSDKCSCRSSPVPSSAGYVSYVPYGYHLVESQHDGIQPMSPSARRKRGYVPLMPNEEPPHLKYTKVKRIDGSKLTAQKVLQDFTKRRFIAYNPRYDLDLLIVPPPIPAVDLLKGNNLQSLRATNDRHCLSPKLSASSKDKSSSNQRQRSTTSSDILQSLSNRDEQLEKSPSVQSPLQDMVDESNSSDKMSEDVFRTDDNNNTNINININSRNCSSIYQSKGVTILPSIKEEPKSKLENHINKLRNGQKVNPKPTYVKKYNHSSYDNNLDVNNNDNNNNNNNSNNNSDKSNNNDNNSNDSNNDDGDTVENDDVMEQDHELSNVVTRRTEQYCT